MKQLFFMMIAGIVAGCGNGHPKADASGTFEASEVVVSAELSGKLLSFTVEEGMTIPRDSAVGQIDATNLSLQRDQVTASIQSLSEKTADVNPQIKLLEDQLLVQQSQLQTLTREKSRTEKLLSQDAATGKQLDDINGQIDILHKQIGVTRQQIRVQQSNTGTQNRSILSEAEPLRKRIAQLDDQLQRASIINPVKGTVLAKYVEAGEVVAPGKALYTVADLSILNLRAYITGDLLPQIRLGQSVTVLIDSTGGTYKKYQGTIIWISDKAEFTPKTIQTKEERANLVYAVKVKVKNDGYLKIGMYGELELKDQP